MLRSDFADADANHDRVVTLRRMRFRQPPIDDERLLRESPCRRPPFQARRRTSTIRGTRGRPPFQRPSLSCSTSIESPIQTVSRVRPIGRTAHTMRRPFTTVAARPPSKRRRGRDAKRRRCKAGNHQEQAAGPPSVAAAAFGVKKKTARSPNLAAAERHPREAGRPVVGRDEEREDSLCGDGSRFDLHGVFR